MTTNLKTSLEKYRNTLLITLTLGLATPALGLVTLIAKTTPKTIIEIPKSA
jgi:hypothetical protein